MKNSAATNVTKKASELKKNGYAATWKLAMKMAWTLLKIKNGIEVDFAFVKADGTLRAATATKNTEKYERKTGRVNPENIITYFDKTANAYRSFDLNRFAV